MAVELATAYISLVPETSKIAPGVRKALGGVERDADRTGQSLGGKISGGLSKSLKVGAAAAGGLLAAGLGVALTKGLGRLTAIENAQAKMRGLGHDAETVDAIMENALASVKGTAFGLGEAASTAAGAVAAGIKPGEALEGVLKSVANSAAASGTSMEDMGGIFNKVASLGKAQNDTLQRVADRGIPIYAALAEQLGVTQEEVFDLASAGKIGFEDFESAMTSASGTVAEEMGKTFTGSLQNMWAAFGRIGANLLSGVFEKFAPAVQGATEWLGKLEPVATRVGEAIGVFATKVTNGLGGIFDLLVKGDFSARFREAFGVEEDHPVVGFLFTLRDTVMTVFGEIKGGITAFAAAWKYNDGEITSSGFPGVMERIGYWARQAFDYIKDTAIPAVVGFIEQFRDGEGAGGKFRDVLTFIYDQAKLAFSWIRDEGIPALQALGDFILNTLWPDIKTAFIDRIWPAMQEVGRVIKDFWEKDAQPALKGLWEFIRDILAPFLVDFYENGIKPTFDLIGKAIVLAWEVGGAALNRLKDRVTEIRENFGVARDRIVSAWETVTGAISGGWDTVKGIFDRFKDGLDSVREKFSSVRDGIRDIWGTIGGFIARPINAVIDTINNFTKGLADNLSKIPGVSLSIPTIPHVPVPSTPKTNHGRGGMTTGGSFADGGLIPGHSPHDRADNIPAWLTAGEYVLPVAATRRLMGRFGPGFMEQLRQGLPGYADGGLVGGRGGALGDALMDGGRFLWDMFKDPVGTLKGMAAKAFGALDESLPAQIAKGVVSDTMGKLASWVKEKLFGGVDDAGGGSTGSPVPGMGWAGIWALVKGLFPDAILTSAVRNSTIAGTNIKSLHASGRAVDFALNPWSRMVGATRMLSMLMPWTELIHTPAGMFQQNRGRRTASFPEITRRMHRDHVHAAMADGGLVKPLLFDSGGYLPTGTSMVHNATGKPEPLMRADKPMRIEGRLRIDGDGFGTLVDARIAADHDHARYESRMVGAR